MSNYPPRKARRTNLVIGIILVILSIAGLTSVTTNNVSGSNLVGSAVFIFILVFMGGYEIGKYTENRLSKQWARLNVGKDSE